MNPKRRDALSGTPMAYFITVTTYGTWLPGDPRGWVSRHYAGTEEASRPASMRLHESNSASMSGHAIQLDRRMQRIVEDTIRTTCRDAGWTLLAIAVQTNHFHLLVASAATAAQTLSRLKGAATRTLRMAEAIGQDQKAWSRQGSTRYLWTKRAVARVRYYIEEMQEDKDVTMPWSDDG